MRRFFSFWWLCARTAFWGNAPFANDWQWLIGYPITAALVWIVGYFYAEFSGRIEVTLTAGAIGALAAAFAAFIITWLIAFIVRFANAPVILYHELNERAESYRLQLVEQNQDGLLNERRRFVEAVIRRLTPEALELLQIISLFGTPPQGFSDSVWQLLLKANLVAIGPGGPNGLNPELKSLIQIELERIEEQEQGRREDILHRLRVVYINTHEVSTAFCAGFGELPSEWVNEQLQELGEKWHVPNKAEG